MFLPWTKKKPSGLKLYHRLRLLAAGPQQRSRGGQLPGLADQFGQGVVGDLWEFDANPAFYADVWRLEVDLRGVGDHVCLRTSWDGNPDGGVAVAVVIIGEHDEDSLGDEEGGLAVGELFGSAGEGEGEFADPVDLGFCGCGFGGLGHVGFVLVWKTLIKSHKGL